MTDRMALVVVAGVLLILTGCGNRKLTSVTITPAADAQNFPNGQVQFTAMGTISDSSKPVPLTTVTWCVGCSNGMCNGNIASSATIDSNGLAHSTPAGRTGPRPSWWERGIRWGCPHRPPTQCVRHGQPHVPVRQSPTIADAKLARLSMPRPPVVLALDTEGLAMLSPANGCGRPRFRS